MLVVAVPVVLMFVAPVTLTPPFKLVRPATPSVPPSVVAPVPTVSVFAPVTLVLPFRLTAPVPVPKVPAPLIAKLPLVWT